MTTLTLSILDKHSNIKLAKSDTDEIFYTYRGEYQAGDRITLHSDTVPCYLMLRLEDSMAPALLYFSDNVMDFTIPFGDDARVYNSKSFHGGRHFLWARVARPHEISAYADLAANPYTQAQQQGIYPCTSSNIVASNIRFASRNAIDGCFDSSEHGAYPFTSWSNKQREDAELHIHFGRDVTLDSAILYLRGDFPHDSWWQQATLLFDGAQPEILNLERSGKAQQHRFTPRTCQSVTLTALHKGDEPAPFTALSQIQLLGYNGTPDATH